MLKVFNELVLSTSCSLAVSYSVPMMLPQEKETYIFAFPDGCTNTVKANTTYTAKEHRNYKSINSLTTGFQVFLSPVYFSLN